MTRHSPAIATPPWQVLLASVRAAQPPADDEILAPDLGVLDAIEPDFRAAWLQAVSPHQPEGLVKRLAWDGIDTHRLAARMGPGPAQAPVMDGSRPLNELLEAIRKAKDLPLLPPVVAAEASHPDRTRAFVDIWAPAAEWALQSLRDDLRRKLHHAVGEPAWRALGGWLLGRLCRTGEQALWQVFNRDRGVGTMLLSGLEADRGAARTYYAEFVRRHRGDALAALLEEFPVLRRLIGTVVTLWREAAAEMLQRADADLPALAKRIGFPADAVLYDINPGLGDAHRGGRSVAILVFAAGDSRHPVVYKPKDMRIDAAYQALLVDLNRCGGDLPPLKTLAVHPCDGYGYTELVSHDLCADAEELDAFYFNAGRLTALLHLLGCTDCHHENLIAHGRHLVLIDTETLFEADVMVLEREEPDAALPHGSTGMPRSLWDRVNDSVFRTGLLPYWIFVGEDRIAMDISALGIAVPEHARVARRGWVAINSDAMRLGVIHEQAELPTSLPVGAGAPNPLGRHLDTFCSGFARQCEGLARVRDAWLAPDGALARFAGLPRRSVLRATRIYFALQQQQLAPEALRSETAQGLRLEQLARAFLLEPRRPVFWPVLASEQADMEQLDIPFFVQNIDGSDLYLPGGRGHVADFACRSGLNGARRRLQALDAAAVAFQLQLVRGAIAARHLRADPPVGGEASARSDDQALPPVPMTTGQRQAIADRIADKVLDMAISDGEGRLEWLGTHLSRDAQRFQFGPVGMSLYCGAMGIAVFLASRMACADARPGPRRRRQEQAVHDIVAELAQLAGRDGGTVNRWWRDQPLGLTGSGGILLGLLALDALNAPPPPGHDSHAALARRLLRGLSRERIERDRTFDLLQGVSGLIGPLLRLGGEDALALARFAGKELVRHQHAGGGWLSHVARGRPPLSGWSHGSAGMSAALARLHRESGEPEFAAAARRALVHERSLFVAAKGNWRDLRSGDDEFMATWCHGAPGIALSRLCLADGALWDSEAEDEIAAAVATTARQRMPADHLCCGKFGLVSVLRTTAARAIPSASRADAAAARLEHAGLREGSGATDGFHLFGTQEGGVLVPGLMTGLSGIGLVAQNDPASRDTLGLLMSGGLLPCG